MKTMYKGLLVCVLGGLTLSVCATDTDINAPDVLEKSYSEYRSKGHKLLTKSLAYSAATFCGTLAAFWVMSSRCQQQAQS